MNGGKDRLADSRNTLGCLSQFVSQSLVTESLTTSVERVRYSIGIKKHNVARLERNGE